MGMFAKSDNVEQKMKKVEAEAISSIIDKSMSITGKITFKGKARIDGTIEGDIKGEHLILSDAGQIKGDISTTSFNCYGKIEGNVRAGILTARKNCNITGKVEAESLTVEPGAAIQGEIRASLKDSMTASVEGEAKEATANSKTKI